jgi:hypothetical protein
MKVLVLGMSCLKLANTQQVMIRFLQDCFGECERSLGWIVEND